MASPGHTPKSSVQHSLARMGMINSPDRRGEMTYLEEFMEQLADGKELQLNEEDIQEASRERIHDLTGPEVLCPDA